jgi:hypothetical protein
MSNIIKRETVKYFVGFLFGFLLWVFILSITPMPDTKVYDCGMAEWHPDIPVEVKEECRKIRGQKKQGYV